MAALIALEDMDPLANCSWAMYLFDLIYTVRSLELPFSGSPAEIPDGYLFHSGQDNQVKSALQLRCQLL